MRICYNCQFFYFDSGSPGYSEYTPGSSMVMTCNKDHWDLDYYDSQDKLRECLEKAQNCPDYQHSDRAKELGIPDEDVLPYTEPIKPKLTRLEPVLCVKCGTQYQRYKNWEVTQVGVYQHRVDRSFTHCPKCEPVRSVQTEGGTFIIPEPVYRTVFE